jgi:hypothetical protein
MKKIFVISIIVLGFGFSSFAQEGLYAGGHFAYNSTWLMNPQVFDEGAAMDVDVPFGYYWGFNLGYEFSEQIGLGLEFNVNTMRQKYVGDVQYLIGDNYNSYTANTELKSFDIPLLLKIGGESYFEIGPVFQFINGATYSATYDDNFTIINVGWYKQLPVISTDEQFSTVSNRNVQETFSKNGIAIAMGFGSDISLIDDALFLSIGVRFQYTLTDMEGINGLGLTKDSPFVPEENSSGNNEKERFKTNPLLGGFKIGLKYKI